MSSVLSNALILHIRSVSATLYFFDRISNKKQQTLNDEQHQQLTNNNPAQSTNSVDNNSVVSLLTYENSSLGIKTKYPVDWKLYEKEYYSDHPDEQWSQVVGFSSPDEINTHSKFENVAAIYVKPLPSQNMVLDTYVKENPEVSRIMNGV